MEEDAEIIKRYPIQIVNNDYSIFKTGIQNEINTVSATQEIIKQKIPILILEKTKLSFEDAEAKSTRRESYSIRNPANLNSSLNTSFPGFIEDEQEDFKFKHERGNLSTTFAESSKFSFEHFNYTSKEIVKRSNIVTKIASQKSKKILMPTPQSLNY